MLVHILNNNKIYHGVLDILFSYSAVEDQFFQYFNKYNNNIVCSLLYFQIVS